MKMVLTNIDPKDCVVRKAEDYERTDVAFRKRRAKERRAKEAAKGLRQNPFAGLAELVSKAS